MKHVHDSAPLAQSAFRSQGPAKVVDEIRHMVDDWRGFELGKACDPYPTTPPRYEPTLRGDRAVTETTRTLLLHWFRREPHMVGPDRRLAFNSFWPHQRRLTETFIYLYEVRGIRRTEQRNLRAGGCGSPRTATGPMGQARRPAATGSGKTKIDEPHHRMGVPQRGARAQRRTRHRPAHRSYRRRTVRARQIARRFRPSRRQPARVLIADPVVPPGAGATLGVKVYSASTCPLKLHPAEGALVVTNYHQLLRTREELSQLHMKSALDRQMDIIFEYGEPDKLEAIQSPLIERFVKSRDARFERRSAPRVGQDRPCEVRADGKGEDKGDRRGWRDGDGLDRSIRKLNGDDARGGRASVIS